MTVPNVQLVEICQNSQQETDTGLLETDPLDPTVTANGSTTSQQ